MTEAKVFVVCPSIPFEIFEPIAAFSSRADAEAFVTTEPMGGSYIYHIVEVPFNSGHRALEEGQG